MTYEVQQTRWDRLIRRVSGSIGPGSRVKETIAELFPMLDVERVPGELLLLGGTRLGMGSSRLNAAAAEIHSVQLFNPVDSGTLISVNAVWASSSTGQICRYDVATIALPTDVGNVRLRDTRLGVVATGLGQIRNDTGATGVTPIGQFRVAGGETFVLDNENLLAVLAPGTGFSVGTTVVNTDFLAAFFWRERTAEESELQF